MEDEEDGVGGYVVMWLNCAFGSIYVEGSILGKHFHRAYTVMIGDYRRGRFLMNVNLGGGRGEVKDFIYNSSTCDWKILLWLWIYSQIGQERSSWSILLHGYTDT